MTDMSVKLCTLLLKTRHNLLDVCEDLRIDIGTLDLKNLGVYQCINCAIWESKKNTVFGEDGALTCVFCDDSDNFKI